MPTRPPALPPSGRVVPSFYRQLRLRTIGHLTRSSAGKDGDQMGGHTASQKLGELGPTSLVDKESGRFCLEDRGMDGDGFPASLMGKWG